MHFQGEIHPDMINRLPVEGILIDSEPKNMMELQQNVRPKIWEHQVVAFETRHQDLDAITN